MQFGEDWKVKIDSMNEAEAKIFILFLETEIARHQWDIRDAEQLIEKVKGKFPII